MYSLKNVEIIHIFCVINDSSVQGYEPGQILGSFRLDYIQKFCVFKTFTIFFSKVKWGWDLIRLD